METMGTKTFVYNPHNRLIQVQEDQIPIADYAYNGMGQRVIKKVGDITTVFQYDFDGNIIAEGQPDGSVSAEYFYMGTNRLAQMTTGPEILSFYLNNHLGTPIAMTDDANTVVWEADYKPFGEAQINPNSEVGKTATF